VMHFYGVPLLGLVVALARLQDLPGQARVGLLGVRGGGRHGGGGRNVVWTGRGCGGGGRGAGGGRDALPGDALAGQEGGQDQNRREDHQGLCILACVHGGEV